MAGTVQTAITPTRSENYPEWYQQVIKAADMAENSPVRGCMVIKPWGYSLWEQIQRILDGMFKRTGHKNAYFPVFIPLSFLQKEAEHVEGFAKECAVITHHRLELDKDNKLVPAAQLEEPLVFRPTSETIIGESIAKWIQSYRDLPLLINQWANVVRWEMRPRLFLRTVEFLWQEGHTVHATSEEAVAETFQMLDVYEDFARNYLAMPVVKGEKTEGERFPGALATYSIEAMMQDRKALQSGTSHFLGQNFAKAHGIKYLDREGVLTSGWTTSWGVSTRLIGGLIMTHSDDDGLILPPRVAPAQVVILPVVHKEETKADVMEYCQKLALSIEAIRYDDVPVRVELDTRDLRGGEKVWSWIKKGVPIRLEVGPRDIESDSLFLGRRDQPIKDKKGIRRGDFLASLPALLDEIQKNLYDRAKIYHQENTRIITSKDDFYALFSGNEETSLDQGGFALAHFAGGKADEARIKQDLNVTARCIPFGPLEPGLCIFTGKPSRKPILFARAY